MSIRLPGIVCAFAAMGRHASHPVYPVCWENQG